MDLTAAWRSAFESWPAELPRAGMIVVAGETVPFVDYLLGDSFIVVERDKPDSSSARKLIIALAAITAVKLTTPDELSKLKGFTEKAAVPVDDGFGMAPSPAARASAALKRTGETSRRPF